MAFTYPHRISTGMAMLIKANFVRRIIYHLKPRVMLTNHDVARVVDTVLSIPGMNESVKIDLKLSRKNVLLLNQVISRGLAAEPDEKTNSLLAGIPKENLEELKNVASEILEKGGLTDLNERLNNLTSSK